MSKRVAILEDVLQVKLFHRTTRRVTITAEGEAVYRWAQRILEDVDLMCDQLVSGRAEPRGQLRISTSFRLGREHIGPALSELVRRHPGLDIRLEVVDRQVDLIREGFDLDIRIGQVGEPNLIAHRLAPSDRILCAAPAYLEAQGTPRSVAELAQHACLVFRERDQAFGVWRLEGPAGLETVKVTGPLSSNSVDIVPVGRSTATAS